MHEYVVGENVAWLWAHLHILQRMRIGFVIIEMVVAVAMMVVDWNQR